MISVKFKHFVTYLHRTVSPINVMLQIFCARFMIQNLT